MITGKEEDWECIWPEGHAHLWKNYPKSFRGALANVTNLLSKDGVDLYITVISEGLNWTGWEDLSESGAINRIKSSAGEGATPIKSLRLAGHSGVAATNSSDGVTVNGIWNVATVFPEQQQYATAKLKKGPPRCWFVRNDPTIYNLGCKSSAKAQEYANRLL